MTEVQTLRARDNDAADSHLRVAWRFAPHNHADQADIGRQSLRLFRPRGLSAAPLGVIKRMECPMPTTSDFYKADFSSTLFPLKMNLLMFEHHAKELEEYIYQKILDDKQLGDNFLPQQRVHATKPRGHLRRTTKLDPVAEYFIYDLTNRNRSIFRKEVSESRRSFGYRFVNGAHISVHTAFTAYKACLADCGKKFKHNIKFDIASYFNSIYHHDLSHWFAGKDGVSAVDSNAFGKFLRDINAGRSVDFLTQGIYPCKMIGNEFLKFIDLSAQLKSPMLVRFMDDFTLFGDDPEVLRQDFIRIQQLLGQYALNVNPSKTYYDKKSGDLEKTLSTLQASLVELVDDFEAVEGVSGAEVVEVEVGVKHFLNQEQINGLLGLLRDDSLEEFDADLILNFLRSHSDDILEQLPTLLRKFPNLTKHIHSVCASVTEKAELASLILDYTKTDAFFLEYQLFWLACIVEDYLLGHGSYGEALFGLFELSADHKIARAKVLEIPEQGFGLKEIRSEYLKTGQSDWLAWASAMGSRSLKAAERNYALNYFSKGSPINHLIAECIKKL
ncbi:MAG TPA: RNA-directed DNA polymerase [Candidatus Competibacter sp.]|nr:RNA-directed DNA polymerase [Candidatus Competibacter sp.]HRW65110.1 RNA-directed DNA polymerase [Candidatus Competibacter sp.]